VETIISRIIFEKTKISVVDDGHITTIHPNFVRFKPTHDYHSLHQVIMKENKIEPNREELCRFVICYTLGCCNALQRLGGRREGKSGPYRRRDFRMKGTFPDQLRTMEK